MAQNIIEIKKSPIKGKSNYKKILINGSGERDRHEYDFPAYYFPSGKWLYFKQINWSCSPLKETWHKMLRTALR